MRRERPARRRSAGASACCGYPTWTRSSGRTRGSRRATSSPTTAASRRSLVPHLRDRPFTMKRYPDGIEGKHFFQKDAPEAHARLDPDAHVPVDVARDAGEADDRLSARERRARAALDGEHGLHRHELAGTRGWTSPTGPTSASSTSTRPTTSASPRSCRSRCSIKELLDALGLEGCPKTSGADGIHVLVPVTRRHTYADTRSFAEIVAGTLARAYPGLVTTEWSKAKRRGVLIDANQNGEGKTIASVYSVRPCPARTGLGAARLGRGDGGARSARLHHGHGARTRRAARRPLRARAPRRAVARRRAGGARNMSRSIY